MDLSELNVSNIQKAKFEKKNIHSVEDLLSFLPRKYYDFMKETSILPPDQISSFTVRIAKITSYSGKANLTSIFCIKEGSGERIVLTYFNQKWIESKYSPFLGSLAYVAGKCVYNKDYDNYQISSPILLEPNIQKGHRIVPVYSKIPRLSDQYLENTIDIALNTSGISSEILPADIISKYNLLPMEQAITLAHRPSSMADVNASQNRYIMNALVEYATRAEWAKRNTATGSPFNIRTIRAYQDLCEDLPYDLTKDQKAAIEEMIKTSRSGHRINALIQGDVGCGKTIVAMIMMALFFDSGYQAALMAPTQVLARQHYEDAVKLLEPHGIRIAFLGGSDMKASERKKVLTGIRDGYYDIVIGTQAIIASSVQYNRLALVITDEEHRFGVAQRKALLEKAMCGVHSITMSATPIPRSLAEVMYGDTVQLITIKSKPSCRKDVITGISTSRDNIYRRIVAAARKGHQTYVVCPMIDDSDDLSGISSVEQTVEEYKAALSPYGIKVASLTGRNTKAETEEILGKFSAGEYKVLISTTVIEVGVNVPTATVIVISNAERFGLASLHQLRGRVGRSSFQSYCVLESTAQTEDGKQRLQAMLDTTDGFEIAKKDLEIRGAGDFLGTKQSGDNKYLSLMLAYPDKYDLAKKIAFDLVDSRMSCPLLDKVIEQDEAQKTSEDTGSSRWISHPISAMSA